MTLEKWAWPPNFSSVLHVPYLLAPPPILKLVYVPGEGGREEGESREEEGRIKREQGRERERAGK